MGEVMSLKEYAETRHISYESVRRQVILYDKELSKDITTQGRTRYLNQRAVDFLDSKRSIQTISVIEEAKEESAKQAIIDELEKELSEKKDLIIRLQQIIIEKDAAYIQLQKDYQALTDKQREFVADPVQKEESEGEAVADPVEQEPHEEESPGTLEAVESVPDEMKAILDSFLAGEISAKEAWELSGLDKKTFSEMYIKYKRELHEEESIERPEEPTREYDAVVGESVKEEEIATHSDHMRADIAGDRESVTDLEENIAPEEVNKGKMSVDEEEPKHDPEKELHTMKLQKFAEEPKKTGLLQRIFSFIHH